MTTRPETSPLSVPERTADTLRQGDDPGLWTMAATLFSAPDSSTLLARVVAAAHQMSGADAVAILLYNRQLGVFEPVTPSVAVGLDETWAQRQGLPATSWRCGIRPPPLRWSSPACGGGSAQARSAWLPCKSRANSSVC